MMLIIPTWFYGFDSLMYLLCAAIGFLLSYYFRKAYMISSENRHMLFFLGFFLLSLGLLSIAVTDTFSYIVFGACHEGCVLGILDRTFSLEDFSYMIYFGLSLLAYSLFIYAYLPEKMKFSKLPLLISVAYLIIILILFPMGGPYRIWNTYNEFFNLTAFLMLILVLFINISNFGERKTRDSMLVAISFALIALFHLFHMFSIINGWFYVFAHISMLSGFLALLYMVTSKVKA